MAHDSKLERTPHTRTDKIFSRWHRELPRHHILVDIDGLMVCHQCRQPIALIETAMLPGNAQHPAKKPVSYILRLAYMSKLPLIIIQFKPNWEAYDALDYAHGILFAWVTTRRSFAPIKPVDYQRVSGRGLELFLDDVRARHSVDCGANI